MILPSLCGKRRFTNMSLLWKFLLTVSFSCLFCGQVSAGKVKCQDPYYGYCYGIPLKCPPGCPKLCEVDCKTCKPYCGMYFFQLHHIFFEQFLFIIIYHFIRVIRIQQICQHNKQRAFNQQIVTDLAQCAKTHDL
jgi:hypothetical protein